MQFHRQVGHDGLYVVVRVDRENRTGDRSGDDTGQDRRDSRFRSIEAFDRFDHQRSGGKRSGKGSCQSCACACGKELFAFATQDMSPFADQVTYVGTHLYGRPLASHRETAAECQHTARKLSQQLAKGMCILDASIDNAPCLRNASASDVRPPPDHPGDEAEDSP